MSADKIKVYRKLEAEPFIVVESPVFEPFKGDAKKCGWIIMGRFERLMRGMGRFNLGKDDTATLEQRGSVTVFRDATDGSGHRLRVLVERERPATETDASE